MRQIRNISLVLLAFAFLSARGGHVAETLSLSAGWNAVYIESTPDAPAPADFFADLPQVERVGCYESSVYSSLAQIASDGTAIAQKPVDPRAKVYDDSLTAPFLAKDAEKFWNAENAAMARETVLSLEGKTFADAAAMSEAIEGYIKEREWPMGKVMNTLRLALTGSASGLGIADIIFLIGVPEATARLDYAAERLG